MEDANSNAINNNQNENNPQSNPQNTNNNSKEEIKKELLEFGFESDKLDLALKMSTDKEEVVNLVVRMMEEPEFFTLIQNNFQINQATNNTNNNNYFQLHNYKMIIMVRKDIQMSVGKIAAQVGHAVLGAYKQSLKLKPDIVDNWEKISGQAKIVLGVDNKEMLLDLQQKARNMGLITCEIHDAGRTQVEPNTLTCCAIGPDIVEKIDQVTGHLKLL